MKKLLIPLVLCCLMFSTASADTLTFSVDAEGKGMSDMLYGLFFEDINYAADGGLYAELLYNRSFEYADPGSTLQSQHLTGWMMNSLLSAKGKAQVMTEQPLNDSNPTYVRISVESGIYRALNAGYGSSAFTGGVNVTQGAEYSFFIYLRDAGFAGIVTAAITDRGGNPISNVVAFQPTADWQKHEAVLIATQTADAYLCVSLDGVGLLDMDMASLMPQTGSVLRADLVEALRDLQPRFLRFPGGCIAEGSYTHENVYNWKDTIGPVEQRKENWNTWGSMQSYGLGYHEYFELCRELNAEPLPVVYAGVLCQARTPSEAPLNKAQCEAYAQDILDLIEYANGGTDTYWGQKRAENGSEQPFGLKYLAIGNENWGTVYFDRFGWISGIVKAAYPDITLIVAAGPVAEGTLIQDSLRTIRSRFPTALADEHYYMDSDWFLKNTKRYDNYPRTTSIFLGEYAAHEPVSGSKRPNNLYSALCEAAYLTGIERNSDLVKLCCYAPLLARDGMQQWTPDLIWFNANAVLKTPNYYVQQMFASTLGDTVLPSTLDGAVYHVVTRTDDAVYIKLVNVSDQAASVDILAQGVPGGEGRFTQLSGQPKQVNTFTTPDALIPVTDGCIISNEQLAVTLPAYSVTIYELPL